MDVLGAIVGLLIQLAFFGLIAWAIVRLLGLRGHDDEADADRSTSVRRLFLYGIMFVTLILSAIGATMIGRTILTSGWSGDERSALALGLSLALVAGPAYGFLLRFARGRLRADGSERTSMAWVGYLNAALATSLIVAAVMIDRFLAGAFGVDDFEWRSIAPAVVWVAVWSLHWFWLRPVHGLPGDLHLAVGSVTGLVTLLIGVGGLADVVGDRVFTSVVERPPAGYESPDVVASLIAVGIGAALWGWHWLRFFWKAERTSLWHGYTLLIGTLGGLAVSVVSGATIAYWTAVWLLGDPRMRLPSEHFEHVPVTVGFLVAGMAAWQYHRVVLQTRRPIERSETLRAYDYLVAACGLSATVIGSTLALIALFESLAAEITEGRADVANRLILAVVLVAIGLPLWWQLWSRIRGHLAADPAAEIWSPSRRLYLIVLFGVGGLTALISLIVVLFVVLDDLLDATFGGDTLETGRVGLALLVTVTGVAWYHLGVFRADRVIGEQLAPTPQPPTSQPTRVVLITPREGESELRRALTTTPALVVETWVRDDDMAMPPIDTDELVDRIIEEAGHDVAVVVGPAGADVIPYVS